MGESFEKASKIREMYEQIWLGLDKVTAVGTGKTADGRICIVISLSSDDPDTTNMFPPEIEDVPIEFRVTGETHIY
jgi:hypothetical protein